MKIKQYRQTNREKQVGLANTLAIHRHCIKSTNSYVSGGVSTELTFHIPGVFPGEYKLLLRHDGHWFMKYVDADRTNQLLRKWAPVLEYKNTLRRRQNDK
jgi:hypothetical protein